VRSIFYFDDETTLLRLFELMFGDDYDVRTAATLVEARRVLSDCPDVIISDLSMPEISGVDFLREAARVCPRSFRILLTGHGSVGDFFSEVSAGVIQHFIPKPWDEEQVREALTRASLTLDKAARGRGE
jgi:DNA-binding NtrC family response regulator